MLNYKNVYSKLSSAGKSYMGTLLRLSANKNEPEMIQRVMSKRYHAYASHRGWSAYHEMHKKMSPSERALDETISDLSQKAPAKDRALISKRFRSKDFPRLAEEHHYGEQYAKKHPVKKVKVARTASGIKQHQPKAKPEPASPELQRRMLARGVTLYRQLTPQGQKYMMECTQIASLDYNNFHQARYGDPSNMNFKQAKLRDRMMRESGYKRSHNESHALVPISIHAMPEDEKRAVDKYLANKDTEEILDNGSAYHQLYLENLRERQLAETRRDEDESARRKPQKQAPGMGVLNAVGRKAPTAFALGEATAGGIGATAKLASRGGRKLKSHFNFGHKKHTPKHAKRLHISDDGPDLG